MRGTSTLHFVQEHNVEEEIQELSRQRSKGGLKPQSEKGVEGSDERNKKAGKWLYKRKCTYKSINGVKSRDESAGQNESKNSGEYK